MGVVASSFQGSDGGIVAEVVEPSSEEWIAKHAEACNCKSEVLWVSDSLTLLLFGKVINSVWQADLLVSRRRRRRNNLEEDKN